MKNHGEASVVGQDKSKGNLPMGKKDVNSDRVGPRSNSKLNFGKGSSNSGSRFDSLK